MTESEFLALADVSLREIESAMEHASYGAGVDVECTCNGNVLEIEFIENGSMIVVNIQAAMQQIWVAAKTGGFHFKRQDNQWIDTREGSELFTVLSAAVSAQAGVALTLSRA
jgi:CyaY protein